MFLTESSNLEGPDCPITITPMGCGVEQEGEYDSGSDIRDSEEETRQQENNIIIDRGSSDEQARQARAK